MIEKSWRTIIGYMVPPPRPSHYAKVLRWLAQGSGISAVESRSMCSLQRHQRNRFCPVCDLGGAIAYVESLGLQVNRTLCDGRERYSLADISGDSLDIAHAALLGRGYQDAPGLGDTWCYPRPKTGGCL